MVPKMPKMKGEIDISARAISSIANQAVNQCYGVVGMADRNIVSGLAKLLDRESKRGIDVNFEEEGISLNIYVIVEYGTRIRSVAESVQNTVKFHIENAMGLKVNSVDVFVQGLRVTDGE